MADRTLVEWTDATWNIITGCEIESPGCKNCYAMRLAGTRLRNHPSRTGLTRESAAGPVWTGETRFNKQWLKQPLKWKRRRKIFVVAHGDLFYEGVPDDCIDLVFVIMILARQHTFQVLTKRVARMAAYIASRSTPEGYAKLEAAARSIGHSLHDHGAPAALWPLPNVWLGASVESQPYADARREPLRQVAAAGWITWVSYEPALGPVNWTGWEFLRWFVAGGESGRGARPSHPVWHRNARDFCEATGVSFVFKQWGQWRPMHFHEIAKHAGMSVRLVSDGSRRAIGDGCHHRAHQVEAMLADPTYGWQVPILSVGKKRAGRQLDGVEHNEYPEMAS